MRGFVHALAVSWRALFVGLVLSLSLANAAPTPGNQAPSGYVQIGKLDQAEGRQILSTFRQSGIPGQYYLEFDLRVLPRRGAERTVSGRLWGARNEQGAITRLAVKGDQGAEQRLLVQNGEQSKVWRTEVRTGAPVTARIVDAFEPLIPGVELTAFELQMPYIYWPDATLEKLVRVRSRPTHVFRFNPPAAFAAQHPEIGGVRAYLDTQFNVPVQTEILNREGRVVRTLSLVDLTKVGDQYIPKSIDLRNEATRDKVRFQVTGAALNLRLPAELFDPARLGEDISLPAMRVQPVAP